MPKRAIACDPCAIGPTVTRSIHSPCARTRRTSSRRTGLRGLAYRYINGIGLASADPFGNPAAYPEVIAAFIERCDAHGWRPASLGVRHDRLTLWQDAGLRAHYLGDEAIVDVESFTLEGRAMRPVRQAANRTKNHGITTEIMREGELSPDLRAALQGMAERHRNGEPERGFSMALDGLLSGRDPHCLVIVARDEHGTAIAFQRYVPCKQGTGLSIDAMRRDAVGPNGVNERMIVDVIEWSKSHGVGEVSLNFAVFKGLIEEGADLKFVEGRRGLGRAAAQPVLPDRVAAHVQCEVRASMGASLPGVPIRRRHRGCGHRRGECRGIHAVRPQAGRSRTGPGAMIPTNALHPLLQACDDPGSMFYASDILVVT